MSGATLPVVLTPAGMQPTAPAVILQWLIGLVTTGQDQYGNTIANPVPGYTANLPGSLIEDISSTDVAAILLCNQAQVELVNSISPYSANPFILTQLGAAYGIEQGLSANGTANVVFTGPVGFVVPVGFTVSDGTNYYQIQDGGIVQTGGTTQPLTAISQTPGTYAIPANTVTQIVTSIPSTISLTCTNPEAGTPGSSGETLDTYRSRVLQACQVAAQGTPAFLKTLLQAIPGVVPQQVSVRSVTGGWEVICGGGDAYAIAGAIYEAMPNLSEVVGSTMSVTAITQANPGQVTTLLNHGYSNGQVVTFSGLGGMTELNTGNYTITVVDEKNFTIGVNTSGYPAFTSGGEVLPNLRNITVTINDYPDTYSVTFVQPPQQTVNVQFVWNTDAVNFVAGASVAALGVPSIVNYINSIPVGAPINLFEMQAAFQQAVASILATPLITRMVVTVAINNVSTPPSTGTGLIAGDPESYFFASSATVTVTQG